MAEVRLFLDRLERYAKSLKEQGTASPELSAALAAIAEDTNARDRYLRFMRALDDPSLAVRMIDLAYELHWFADDERRAELGNLIAQRYDRSLTAADVDFACKLDVAHALDATRATLAPPKDVGQAAIRGCLGDDAQRTALLGALTSADPADVQIAQVYLGYHPIAGVAELREIASAIGTMRDTRAQVRALDTLADHRVSDPETLADITRLFEETRSIEVQRAIAGVLLRSDYPLLAMPTLARTLREHRLESHEGRDLIDVLIDRLDASA
jgi:hypothetical protein